ncbi:hypothetical protein D9M73_104860 [compost metagenome]
MALREFVGAAQKGLDARAVDELHGAAGPGRKADTEDGADIGVMHAGQHTFGEAACGFNSLAVKQAVLDLLNVPGCIGFLEQLAQLGPELFFAAGRVVVKTATARTAGAFQFLDHAFHQQLAGCGCECFTFGGEVGARLVEHMHAECESGFVQHRQRSHGHAGLHGGVLDHGCRNAFAQQGRALHHKSAKGAAGVKTARVVDHDGHLAQRLHIIEGACHGFVVGGLAADDLHEFHLVHGAEEMNAHEFLGMCTGLCQARDRQRGGIAGKKSTRSQLRFGLACDLGLEFAAFEHRFNDELATREVAGISGGGDALQQRLLCGGIHAALVHPRLREFLAVGLAGFGFLAAHILEHGGDAPAGLGPGNARAHHARTEDADLRWFVARGFPGA